MAEHANPGDRGVPPPGGERANARPRRLAIIVKTGFRRHAGAVSQDAVEQMKESVEVERSADRIVTLWVSLSRSGELFPSFAAAMNRTRPGQIRLVATPKVLSDALQLAPGIMAIELPRIVTRLASIPRMLAEASKALRQVWAFSNRRSLIHVLMPSPLDVVFLAPAKFRGVKVLVTVHDARLHPGENGLLQRVMYRLSLACADDYVTVSRFVHAAFVEVRPGRTVFLVENGLIEDLGAPSPARLRARGQTLRLLFHGRIRTYKGVHVLLEAMALIEARRRDITLTIAGEGADADLRSAAAALATVETIFERTSDSVRAQLYERADVNVLPYLEASQSGVAQRGLFAALPAIATPVGALPEQLIDGDSCLMVPPGNAVELAAAIETLADHPDLYNRLSEGARAAAVRLQPDVTARRWNDLYNSL